MAVKRKATPAAPALRVVPTAEVHALVTPVVTAPAAVPSTAERVRKLQAEARALAHEEIEALALEMDQTADRAREIALGGDVYPVGAREIASRLVTDLPPRAETLRMILTRV